MEGVLGETDPADYIVQPCMIKGNVVTVDVVRSSEQGHMRSYLARSFCDS